MKRVIYMFYALVLLSALSWRLASASSEAPQILGFMIREQAGETDIVLSLSRMVKPFAQFSGRNNCLVLEFPGAVVAENLFKKAFTGRDLKLGYLAGQVDEETRAKVRLYIRQECLASIRYSEHDVIVRLAEKASLAGQNTEEEKALLNPQEEKYSPAVISLQDAPFQPAVMELATQAGIELKLAGQLPEVFSLELEAASPFEALRSIADVCNLKLERDGKVWMMSGA